MTGDRARTLLVFGGCLTFAACVDVDVDSEASARARDHPQLEENRVKQHRCDPATLPMRFPDPVACCEIEGDQWFVVGYPSASNPGGSLAHRAVGGLSCTTDGVTRGCTGMGCPWGPCGSKTLPGGVSAAEGQTAYVFRPVSDPAFASVCGRQAPGSGVGFPESYVDQESYPKAKPACPYTGCLPTGPVVTLVVAGVSDHATGDVSSSPVGIVVGGTGTASARFHELDITLHAQPRGPRARAVFSGDCKEVGHHGAAASCRLTLGPDKRVTVTYQCQDGFRCEL